jgi:hypothetical protein
LRESLEASQTPINKIHAKSLMMSKGKLQRVRALTKN